MKKKMGFWFKVFIFIVLCILRPIWSFVFNAFYFAPKYFLLLFIRILKGGWYSYFNREKSFNEIISLYGLVEWFSRYFQYKYEGFFDHDNTALEFFMGGGDCDDMALFAKRKLQQLGMTAVRIWFEGHTFPKSGHFDCLFKNASGEYCLFNYGNVITGNTLEETIKEFTRRFHYPHYVNTRYFLMGRLK